MRVWSPFEQLCVSAILTGDDRYFNVAKQIIIHDHFTLEDLNWSEFHVRRYLRTRGYMQMLPLEYMALLKIQAVCRGYLERSKNER